MCEITLPRGFIILLLGEAKVKSEIEFFNKSLQVVCEKLCRILSRTTRPIYLSFVPQDVSPYNLGDPIALSWELVSGIDECRSHLCEKLYYCGDEESKNIAPLDLSKITGIFHGLLTNGIGKLGHNVLLDVIIIVSESGVSQLSEGKKALELYGATRRVRWQNGHITAVYPLPVSKHLLISPAVNTTVVMSETENLDCIDENVWWRGAYLPAFNPFDTENREKQMTDVSISINYESQEQFNKEDKKTASKKKKLVEDKDILSEFHLLILVVKEVVNARFPLFLLDSSLLNLYGSDEKGQRALLDLRGRLTSLEGEDSTETAAIIALVPCCLENTLNTDAWYKYIIGEQTHWINSLKIKLFQTPNYCVPFQTPSNGIWRIWKFKHKLDLPKQLLQDYHIPTVNDAEKEEEPPKPMGDTMLPQLNTDHINIIHSVWSELVELTPPSEESGEGKEEFQSRVNKILQPLNSLPPAPKVLLKRNHDKPTEDPEHTQDMNDTLEYKALCAMDRYYNLSKEPESYHLKSLGGLSPPPMTDSKDKIGVDSLLKCFDQEGYPIGDLEPVSLPSLTRRKDVRARLFGDDDEANDTDHFFEHFRGNTQKHFVKNETKGLMNYESPQKPKVYYKSSLFQETSSSHSRSQDPVGFLRNKISKNEVKSPFSKSNTKKLTPKHHLKTKVRIKSRKPSETKRTQKSVSESTGDKELRSLLERAVVKALKGEQLNRDHPQFKPAYTQLFNVCKCFLAGLDAEAAKEKVEQLAISNAKQVIELQVKK